MRRQSFVDWGIEQSTLKTDETWQSGSVKLHSKQTSAFSPWQKFEDLLSNSDPLFLIYEFCFIKIEKMWKVTV